MTDREMVRLAGERVMGWHVYRSGRGSTVAMVDKDADTEHELILETTHPWEEIDWNPLESIADAWMLVEAFIRRGHRYSVELRGMENSGWSCRLEDNGHSDSIVEDADTAPRAIVMACLRAVGVEI